MENKLNIKKSGRFNNIEEAVKFKNTELTEIFKKLG